MASEAASASRVLWDVAKLRAKVVSLVLGLGGLHALGDTHRSPQECQWLETPVFSSSLSVLPALTFLWENLLLHLCSKKKDQIMPLPRWPDPSVPCSGWPDSGLSTLLCLAKWELQLRNSSSEVPKHYCALRSSTESVKNAESRFLTSLGSRSYSGGGQEAHTAMWGLQLVTWCVTK